MTGADFDRGALDRWLDETFGPAATRGLERIAGGQSNPTFFLTHGDRRMVLRKKPAGPLLPGAHAIEREYRVLAALHPQGAPVARPILLHEDPGLLGTPFYLMERVEGRVFSDCALAELPREERPAIWMGLADALAAMHAVEPAAVGLGDYGRPGNYFERQIARWTKQWRAATAVGPIADIDWLAEWLPANLPADDGRVRLVHGDFRMGNMLFHPSEPRVVAILDWELSTLGHPLADLGFCAMPWSTTPEEYGGILGLDHAALNLPAKEDFVARYAAGTDSGALLPFHEAFALFRFAVIFVGIAERAAQGTAAGADAREVGPLAARFARRGVEIARGLRPQA